ncbi:50S ribosomal protein L7ae [Leuconostoc carnosum]|uniref:Ribosomal protein L7AE n=1 Tax=Leuconostoc carnosum (strain JB16) TaxID=1229758 RepID=K0D9M8_LEUCJ|nr:ribosomal L7Ae/L30e/S12e/Gadd45 family protein [Leuconostoc carnosum]AFT81550.1 ribosomal protein L7AE [Leuconostoc carnosum JB16]KAA8330354.1 50S ribosomal protein L7ae [Leuconostoc carnosum]KAA8370721.1 50S ribosomal protein L7ae [Leuconostoc carnosum]KAA8382365.1 50S ribosomal protein L7ae [Leuconostoc carnosum]
MISKDDQILNLLGLAMRAGKLVLGTDSTLTAIRAQKVQLAFFPSDGGQSQAKKFIDKSTFYNVTLVQDYTKSQLIDAIGVNRSVFAIADRGFSRKIKQLILEKERN